MQKNTLTQKKLFELDKISKKCGCELLLPPSKVTHHPFFVLNEHDEADDLIKALAQSKFIYAITRSGTKKYISIKG